MKKHLLLTALLFADGIIQAESPEKTYYQFIMFIPAATMVNVPEVEQHATQLVLELGERLLSLTNKFDFETFKKCYLTTLKAMQKVCKSVPQEHVDFFLLPEKRELPPNGLAISFAYEVDEGSKNAKIVKDTLHSVRRQLELERVTGRMTECLTPLFTLVAELSEPYNIHCAIQW